MSDLSAGRKRRRRLLFAGIVLLGALGGLEGGLRLIYDREDLLFAWERRSGLTRFEDGGLRLRPGVSERRQDGPYRWEVRTNDLALRDDPVGADWQGRRLLALGDSWIFGNATTQDRTISEQLEGMLATTDVPVRVVNAGVVGHGAVDMLQDWYRLQDLGWDGVILGMPHNLSRQTEAADRAAIRAQADLTRRAAPRWSFVYLLLRWQIGSLRAAQFAPSMGSPEASVVADLQALIRSVKAAGLPVWFIFFPTYWGEPPIDPLEARGDIRAMLDAEGVPYGGHLLRERRCWGWADYAHPGEAGAWAIATVMAGVIRGDAGGMRESPRCEAYVTEAKLPQADTWP